MSLCGTCHPPQQIKDSGTLISRHLFQPASCFEAPISSRPTLTTVCSVLTSLPTFRLFSLDLFLSSDRRILRNPPVLRASGTVFLKLHLFSVSTTLWRQLLNVRGIEKTNPCLGASAREANDLNDSSATPHYRITSHPIATNRLSLSLLLGEGIPEPRTTPTAKRAAPSQS